MWGVFTGKSVFIIIHGDEYSVQSNFLSPIGNTETNLHCLFTKGKKKPTHIILVKLCKSVKEYIGLVVKTKPLLTSA